MYAYKWKACFERAKKYDFKSQKNSLNVKIIG